jgi:hypothetical protein
MGFIMSRKILRRFQEWERGKGMWHFKFVKECESWHRVIGEHFQVLEGHGSQKIWSWGMLPGDQRRVASPHRLKQPMK